MPGRMFTLLDPASAKSSKVWRYVGEFEECTKCSVREICHGSLYPGMLFEVLERRNARNYCKLRDLEIESVEISRPIVTIAIDSRLAKEGAITEYSSRNCLRGDCPFIELCEPLDLGSQQRMKVMEVIKSFPCSSSPDRSLSIVRAEPL